MLQPQLKPVFFLVLFALVLVGCGGERNDPPPGGGDLSRTDATEPEIPDLVVRASRRPPPDRHVLIQRLFKTRAPTSQIVSDLLGEQDPRLVSALDTLRSSVLAQLNMGWVPISRDGRYWAEDRTCSPEALNWKRAMCVEVIALHLRPEVAKSLGAETHLHLVPLKGSKDEVLETAHRQARVRGKHGPVALRAGETARLTVGWTRARLRVKHENGQTLPIGGQDVFDGLRVALTARAEAEAQPWELEVYSSIGGLESDTAVRAYSEGEIGQDTAAAYAIRHRESSVLRVTQAENCWIMSMRGKHEKEETQVVVCARVQDLD